MPTVAKIKWPKMGLDYGWLFKISSLPTLMEYWDKVRSNRMRDGFSNLLRSRGNGAVS